MEIEKEGKEEGVKRWVVTAHLVGREMFGKVPRKQLLSSHPLAMKDFTYPLLTRGQSPRGAQARRAWGHWGPTAEKASKAPVGAALEPAAGWCCPRANCSLQCICHGEVSSVVHSLVKLQMEKCSLLESCAFSNILDEGVQRCSAGVTAYTARLCPEQKGLGPLNLGFGRCEDVVSHLLWVNFC